MKKLLFFLTLAPGAFASAQTAPPVAPVVAKPAIDPAAVALLDQSAAAYAKLNGLKMHFSTFNTVRAKTTSINGEIAFSRPGKAKVTFKRKAISTIFQSDGSTLFFQLSPLRVMSFNGSGDDAVRHVLSGLPSALHTVLPSLAVGKNLLGLEVERWDKVALLPNNGVAMTSQLYPDAPFNYRLYFGAADHLLRRVEFEIKVKRGKNLELTTLSSVQTNPHFAPDTFKFKPKEHQKRSKYPPLSSSE